MIRKSVSNNLPIEKVKQFRKKEQEVEIESFLKNQCDQGLGIVASWRKRNFDYQQVVKASSVFDPN